FAELGVEGVQVIVELLPLLGGQLRCVRHLRVLYGELAEFHADAADAVRGEHAALHQNVVGVEAVLRLELGVLVGRDFRPGLHGRIRWHTRWRIRWHSLNLYLRRRRCRFSETGWGRYNLHWHRR